MKEEKEAIPEMEMRQQEAEAIMQGKGYGNPHAGMPVDEHGNPIGGNPHDPEFMKAHGDSMPGGGANPHAHGAHGGGANPHAAHGPGAGEAQKPFDSGKSEAKFDDVDTEAVGGNDDKELGDDEEESVGDLGRDRNDDL